MSTFRLSGRISAGPHELLCREVLEPQLRFELEHLLPHYVGIEKVLLVEYHRMDVLAAGEVAALAARLDAVNAPGIAAIATENMSDIAFAVERFVSAGVVPVPAAWHVDRSRNDLQATAQCRHGRDRLLEIAGDLITFGEAALDAARRHESVVLPGYTHSQAAQVISPAFYLTALTEQVLHALRRIHATEAGIGAALGAGAMAGQELPWDRARMARLLGFDQVSTHALRAVAQRDWALEATAELSLLGVALSRFATDLITWGGAGYGFLDLPDEWSGISSAMPQKKNFPVLERIRARTAHLSAAHFDVALAQRATPFTNSVEISKEASAGVPQAFDTAGSVLRLFTAVLANLEFRADRTRAACEADYLGGFTLANLLTLRAGVPWRTAQVVAGRYISAAIDAGLRPREPDAHLLTGLAEQAGHPVEDTLGLLRAAFDVDAALDVKRTTGSVRPGEVKRMVEAHGVELDRWRRRLAARTRRIRAGGEELDAELARIAGPAC